MSAILNFYFYLNNAFYCLKEDEKAIAPKRSKKVLRNAVKRNSPRKS